MQPSRILPDLQCSLVCEQVRREANGNFFLIGVLDGLVLPQFPIGLPGLCVFNRWTSGLGQFTSSVRLVAPDQETVIQKGDVKFSMKDPNRNATTLLVLQQIRFQEPGTYFFEVMVDDVMKVRYPLPVLPLPQPPAPAQSASEPPPPEPA
jgi:Family of unknown function (DUF6941)